MLFWILGPDIGDLVRDDPGLIKLTQSPDEPNRFSSQNLSKMWASPTLKEQSRVFCQVSNTKDFVVLRAVTQHALLCCVIPILDFFLAVTQCYKHNTRPSCCVICVIRVILIPENFGFQQARAFFEFLETIFGFLSFLK